jgi:hypothetical protein
MQNLPGNLRYALRQFRLSPVFTAAAVLTLALGIGGTTAIFTLIHAVMLRSLPVSDPGRLYRVGEGDDCCVEGGPQDTWGMFSFRPLNPLLATLPQNRSNSLHHLTRQQRIARSSPAVLSPLLTHRLQTPTP